MNLCFCRFYFWLIGFLSTWLIGTATLGTTELAVCAGNHVHDYLIIIFATLGACAVGLAQSATYARRKANASDGVMTPSFACF